MFKNRSRDAPSAYGRYLPNTPQINTRSARGRVPRESKTGLGFYPPHWPLAGSTTELACNVPSMPVLPEKEDTLLPQIAVPLRQEYGTGVHFV